MTTPHRTLQMALDALDAITDDVDGTGLNTMPSFDKAIDAIAALREALAQPEPIDGFGGNLDEAFEPAPPAAPAPADLTPFERDLLESVGQMKRGEGVQVYPPAPAVPAEAALNTLARLFHNGEEIEGDDGAAMMVDLSLWHEASEAFDSLIGDGDGETLASSAAPAVREPLTDARKLCTCDGAGRGPGRACVVQAGGRLGDLWKCAKSAAPAVPDDIAAIIACLGDDAALLRETTDDSEEIAQNMDDAAAALERLSAAPAVPLTDEQFADMVAEASLAVDLAASPLKLLAFARAVLSAAPAVREPQPEVLQQVMTELDRATRKFPKWPTDPLHALAVLGEEFGELTKAMLQFTYEPHKKVSRTDIREEAIQTAAMALRLAMSLPLYDYAPGPQHKQHGIGGGGK